MSNKGLIALIGLGAVGVYLYKGRTDFEPGEFDDLYRKWGERYNVPPVIIKAVAQQESAENPRAMGDLTLPYGPAVGLMQILAQGYPGPITRKLRGIEGWPPIPSSKLLDPDYNISIGTQLLADAKRRHGPFTDKMLADYNGGPNAVADFGPHRNQEYVDRVQQRIEKVVWV